MQSKPKKEKEDESKIKNMEKDFEERKKVKVRTIDRFRKTTNLMILTNRLKQDQKFYDKYYWILNQLEKDNYERINPESISPVKKTELK